MPPEYFDVLPLISVTSYECRVITGHTHGRYDLHQHDAYEILIHLRGQCTLRVEGVFHTLTPLIACVIAPGQIHSVSTESTSLDAEYLELQLTPTLLEELSFRDCCLQDELDRIVAMPGQRLQLTAELWRNIYPLTTGIKEPNAIRHPTERQITLGCLSALLGILCFASERGSAPYVTTRSTQQTIRYIGMHISQNFRDDCSLEHLADVFSMSKYHLARSFKQTYGVSLHQYVLDCRITYARRLLHQGEAPSTVSQACGFNDYSSFLRAFTRQTGISPAQWKKQHTAGRPLDEA